MAYQLTMQESFDCSRDTEEVFNYIIDFSRIDEWDHTIESAIKTSDGPIEIGSRFDLVFSMGLRKVPITYEIIELDKPSKTSEPQTPYTAVLRGTNKNFVSVDTATIIKTDTGCHVNWRADLDFTGLSAKIVPVIENKIKQGGVQTIKDLALALEDNFPAPSLGVLPRLADKLIAPGVLSFTKFGYALAKKNWQPVTASIRGKQILITGATSGLGLAAATELAHRGAHLTLVARNRPKADDVLNRIIKQTGNTHLQVEIADLSEMSEVVALGKRLLKKRKPLDVLINNAGALLNEREENSEGLEKSFALLLLGPSILTQILHPRLAKSAGARVINVSSGGMYATRISVSNLQNEKNYRGTDAYARAKRGLVIKGEQWAEQWQNDNITVHNMHPGWALTPGVETSLPGFTKKTRKVLRTPEQGADTIVWLANASEAAKTSGLFWLDRRPHSTHLSSKTRETSSQREAFIQAIDNYVRTYLP